MGTRNLGEAIYFGCCGRLVPIAVFALRVGTELSEFMGTLPPQAPVAGKGKDQVKHLVVVIPGIGGSALRSADKRPLWAFTPGAVTRPVRHVKELTRAGDNLADPDFSDGVEAYGLMAVPIPGLTRLFGSYQELRDSLFANFSLVNGLNYLEFPYDWRRPVTVNAKLLAACVGERLTRLRQTVKSADVVIVAHSMGGLVGGEYLAHHSGGSVVRRMITLGTPFRGAPKALDFLVNGPRIAHVRFRSLAAALGRIPSLYDLLPVYQLIGDAREPAAVRRTVAEALHALPALAGAPVRTSAAFLELLNEEIPPTQVHPLIGFGAKTVQQAVLDGSALRVSAKTDLLPTGYQQFDGDGTVPAVAAMPRAYERADLLPAYQNQTHGGLVTGNDALGALVATLRVTLRDGPVLDPGTVTQAQPPAPGTLPTVTLDVADFYVAGEPVRVAGEVRNWPPGREIWYRLGNGGAPARAVRDDDGSFTVDLSVLTEGVYRLDLLDGGASGPVLLSDVIEAG